MANYTMGNQIESWKGGIAQTLTFVITQDCNLRCKYCYMMDKNTDNIMTFDVGKKQLITF